MGYRSYKDENHDIHSTDKNSIASAQIMIKGKSFKIKHLSAGECKVYKVINNKQLDEIINNNSK